MTFTLGMPYGAVQHVDSVQAGVDRAKSEGAGGPVSVSDTGFGFWVLSFEQPGWKLYSKNRADFNDIID